LDVRIALLRGPFLAALLWSALALASAHLREAGGAVLLVWLPSAVAVASLYATPSDRWRGMIAALGAAQLGTCLALGIPWLQSAGFALAGLVEAVVCASLALRLLGGRDGEPRGPRHVFGLFGVALLGCAVSALVAYPFRQQPGWTNFGWWFLATVLGVLTATPVLLRARRWLPIGEDDAERLRHEVSRPGFMLTVAALFLVGALILTGPSPTLLPVLFVAIVFAVIRYGQLAGACGVIAYAAAGILVSLGGRSPAPFLDLPPFAAGVVLQSLMLLMLATALPIAGMLMTRDKLEARLRQQNAEMRSNLTILSLAESLAGIGRWRYDMRSGNQQWSPLMLELNGLPRDLTADPGNIRALLPDGGERLFGELAAHRADREPYSFQYRVAPPGSGAHRILKIHVSNEFDEAGERTGLFAVAMDVTQQVERERALDQARKHAIGLAAEAQKLANTDSLTGLANRRATFDWLGRLVAVADEADQLALLIFDIDHFKRVNDLYGHQTGDEVLKRVAAIARAQVRPEDLVGRIGGEEFVCILSGLGAAEVRTLAERLCRTIAAESDVGGLPPATISVGLASLRAGDTPEALFARADTALYEAKDAGRNRVRRVA
jgi:diguanylate cyclase (GGDEF)-like protein